MQATIAFTFSEIIFICVIFLVEIYLIILFQLRNYVLKKATRLPNRLSQYRRRYFSPMTCGFAVFVAAAAVAAAELAVAAAVDVGLSAAFQSGLPFLPGLLGCIAPPA